MKKGLFLCSLLLLGTIAARADQASYRIEPLAEGVYAAIALPGGRASSNAFFVVARDWVLASGAHMTRDALLDLQAAVATVTPRRIDYFVLPHHHRGFAFTDFDFPSEMQVIMSGATWESLQSEVPAVIYPVMLFSEGLTLKSSLHTVVLTNLGRGHAEGDVALFLPESRILFTSDLVYAGSIGYLGDGHMQEWVLGLEFFERLQPTRVVPGFGPVSDAGAIREFRVFLRDFLSEVLRHLELGHNLEQTRQEFRLPRHAETPGFRRFLDVNLERAYHDLQQNLLK